MKEANPYENISTDELPDVLTAQHVAAHLHLSRRHVYELFRTSTAIGGIKTFSIGKTVRTYKTDYLDWLDQHKASIN